MQPPPEGPGARLPPFKIDLLTYSDASAILPLPSSGEPTCVPLVPPQLAATLDARLAANPQLIAQLDALLQATDISFMCV